MSMPNDPPRETDPASADLSRSDGTPPDQTRSEPQREATRKSEFLHRAAISSLYVAGAAGALGGLEFWRGRFQNSRVFAPSRHPEGEWDPAAQGLPCRDVTFASGDGTPLHGWWLETAADRPALLYCHGSSGSLGTRLDVLSFLHGLETNILAFDYRGYGRSGGAPSEKGVFQDARAAYDFARSELGADPGNTLILGHSLGGAIAIDLALNRPAAGLVVQSTFTDLRGMALHRHAGSPLHLLARNQFRNRDKLERLAMPKLFVHGTADTKIPFTMGEELFAAAPPPKVFFPVPGAGHNDLHRHGEAYFRALRRFVERCCGD